jgi:hypothetical protein
MDQSNQPGWFARNWKWVVPLGCCGMIAAFVVFIIAIIALVFGAIRSSDACQEAVRRAENHPALVAQLGTPIKVGWFVTGSINVSGSSGDANLQVPISGPKNSATLSVVATLSGGKWNFTRLQAEVAGQGPPIDLLPSRVVPTR